MSKYEVYELIPSLIGNFLLIVSLLFIYFQVKLAAKTLNLDGILKVNEMFKEIGELSREIYNSFPQDIVMKNDQFCKNPPPRLKRHRITEAEQRRLLLTEKQITALASLTDIQKQNARKLIGLLNDIGQLAEDKIINYDMILGKYHTIIIRLSLILEPIRREAEASQKESIGGNYGQRLLRMRHKALLYNQIHPKHREVDIRINMNGTSIIAIEALENTFYNRILCFGARFEYMKK